MRSGTALARRCVGAAVTAILAMGSNVALAQVSPGPLARAHASLSGQLDCLKCHDQGKKGLDQKCLACHKEIAATLAARRGLHGKAQLAGCARCHPDHAGRDFAMIAWEEGSAERFDHSKTTFSLEGKHRKLECRDCHNAKLSVSPIADLSPRKDRATGFVGLEGECKACHKDPHQKVLGEACSSCHGQDAWKPAAKFQHQDTTYPLTGKHATTKCDACHGAERLNLPIGEDGKPVPRWKPLPHAECSECHKDPHAKGLGPDCTKCHVTEDFKKVERDRFDHERTRYPLRGKHTTVKCESCHSKETAWGPKPRFEKCSDCHKDAHGGKDLLAGKPADCGACHGVAAFKPSTYTAAMHAQAAYPLTGKHAKVACDRCHPKVKGPEATAWGSAAVLLRPKHAVCTDCHEDAHRGQTTSGERRGGCETCHTSAGWKPATFTIVDHERTHFALVGRHAKVACSACHGPERPGLAAVPPAAQIGSARVWLRIDAVRCEQCHKDPHNGRFGPKGDRPQERGCLACHGQNAFRPAAFGIDEHARSAFKLEGAHRAVPCGDCHKVLARTARTSALILSRDAAASMEFRERFALCQDCHETPHGKQFDDRPDRGACQNCHGLDAFTPATAFHHESLAAFALTGAHRGIACEKCHPRREDASGQRMVVYRPVPHECKDCHGTAIPTVGGKRIGD